MRPEGSSSSRSLLIAIIVIVVVIVVDRAQEMGEDPLGHVAALFSCLHVCKAEVDALEDARVDHVVGCSRETVIRLETVTGWSRRTE